MRTGHESERLTHGDEADFLILGTGVGVDLADRSEFAAIVKDIALWEDRYDAAALPAEADPAAGRFPYLGPHFELVEKRPGTLPGAAQHSLCSMLAPSSAPGSCPVGWNGMPWGIRRLVAGVSADFYRAEVDRIFEEFEPF